MADNTLNSMLEMAKETMEHSYSPYSRYRVGACIRTENDRFFSATNVENASYGLCVCAETAAIAAMISAGEHKIQDIVITSKHQDHPVALCAPCGACRQRLYEFASSATRVHLADNTGIKKTYTISELIPEAFGPNHLK
jgi:cytidine deaminase